MDSPFGPVIFSYTRKQAIEDGVLVDLSEWAKDLSFTIPVACTAAVWNQYVTPPEGTRELGQSERGRAHDLLWMLFLAIGRLPKSRHRRADSPDELRYQTAFLNSKHLLEAVQFKAICGPGDDGEPVLTILLLEED
ncbi:MAG: hypothetical protein IT445_12150 [Phycisphaeraceae bacterium]|nr:hypothetical protein [Phycisphaeraceae bacterium]